MRTHIHPRPAPGGFTLMELLVAMFLATIIIAVSLWMFVTTQTMVNRGTQQDELMAGVAYFDNHLRQDIKGLMGPIPQKALAGSPSLNTEGGVMIIVPGMREGMLQVKTSGGVVSRKASKLRCDQLVMLYGKDSPALAPASASSARYQYTLNAGARDTTDANGNGDTGESAMSGQARIYYGHVRRVAEPTENGVELAYRWIMGRQGLLLVQPAAGAVQRDSLIPDQSRDVAVYGDRTGATALNAWQLLANDLRGLAGTRGVVDPLTSASTLNQSKGNLGTVDKAYLDLFLPGGSAAHCNPADRLHEAGQPLITTTPLDDNQLTVDDLFKSHMQCMANCSECIIQFAGDLDKNGIIDTETIAADPSITVWNAATAYAMGTRVSRSGVCYTAKNANTNKAPESNPNNWFLEKRIVWYPRDTEVFGAAAGAIPGPFVFRADDWQSRTVRYPYKQDGRYYTNKYGDQFPYPYSEPTNPFGGWGFAGSGSWWNPNHVAAGAGNGRHYPWPAQYDDARSLPDDAVGHGAGSTNFGDGLDSGPGGVGNGVDDPTVLAADMATNFPVPALVGNGVVDDENAAYATLLADYPQAADAGWRRRVSDWPWMVRIRLRLHDDGGNIFIRNDAMMNNGRDDDGDGVVDGATAEKEATCSGYWSEHIFAVPRPRWFQ